MKTADIVIAGSGSLASGVAYAFSQLATIPVRIALIGRSTAKVTRIALIANARAGILRTSATFEPITITQFNAATFARLFRSLEPKIIFNAASLQSPWEAAEGPNGWTKLLASAGFGATLPLQMALVAEISRAANDSRAAIVNASYPDAVNVALHHLGLRITCGLGNSAIVEAFCRGENKLRNRDVRVIGHHGHLAPWLAGKRSAPQPRIWVGGREVASSALRPGLDCIDEELNHVTSASAVSLLMSLFSGNTLHTSIPGVVGLPGGYPFLLSNRKFTLRLPPGISLEQAIAHNKTGEHSDGLNLDTTSVSFVGKTRRALASIGFAYAQGFALAEWQKVRDCLLGLRKRLRSTAPTR